jgi:hypothetical protein
MNLIILYYWFKVWEFHYCTLVFFGVYYMYLDVHVRFEGEVVWTTRQRIEPEVRQ